MHKEVEIKCQCCNKTFSLPRKRLNERLKRGQKLYCSRQCGIDHKQENRKIKCLNCEVKTLNSTFCSQSCSATYNNKKREQGTLRSKLEMWLEPRLLEEMPDVVFKFNRKDDIGSELDISCPNLKLGIELNGTYHYFPIMGESYLKRVQENDRLKVQACKDTGWKLVVIDTRPVSYITTKTGWKYLRMIMEEVDACR